MTDYFKLLGDVAVGIFFLELKLLLHNLYSLPSTALCSINSFVLISTVSLTCCHVASLSAVCTLTPTVRAMY